MSTEVDEEIQEDLRGNLDLQARLLYGLIHARWIVTARGLAKMVRHPTPDLLVRTAPTPPNPFATTHRAAAREVQARGLRPLPTRPLPIAAAPPRRAHRRAVREVGEALLRPLRGHLLAQVVPPRVDRRRVLRDVLPAPPLPRLPQPHPAEERARRSRAHGARRGRGRQADSTREGRARDGGRGRGDEHGERGAQGGSVPAENIWVPGERDRQAAAVAGGGERQVRAQLCCRAMSAG